MARSTLIALSRDFCVNFCAAAQSDDASESDFIAGDANGGGGGGGDDEYEQGFSGEAKLMRKFIKRVDREPTQCARYEFGGKPLWMSDAKPTKADVPPCPHCAAERYARERELACIVLFSVAVWGA
jgi:hypothetical protein